MKLVTLLLIIGFSFSVLASPTPVACEREDYIAIVVALENEEIRSGFELKNTVLDWLMIELGPRCSKLVGDFGYGIPGQDRQNYELDNNAGQIIKITITTSRIGNPSYVFIRQLQ